MICYINLQRYTGKKMISAIKRRLVRRQQYYIIKNSGLFDVNYYINTYKDIKSSGVDPIYHYIDFGWKERRNPSKEFNTEKYINSIGMQNIKNDPITHYLKNKELYNKYLLPYQKCYTIKELLSSWYKIPYSFSPILKNGSKANCLNIYISNFSEKSILLEQTRYFIGVIKILENNSFSYKIISNNFDEKLFREYVNMYKIPCNNLSEVDCFNSHQRVELSINDPILAFDWTSALVLKDFFAGNKKIFFFAGDINDFECISIDERLQYLLLLNDENVLPIFPSSYFKELLSQYGFDNKKANIITFNKSLKFDCFDIKKKKDKKKNLILLYSEREKNTFLSELIILNKAISERILKKEEWKISILFTGEVLNFKFDQDVELENFKLENWNQYLNEIVNSDLIFSLKPLKNQQLIMNEISRYSSVVINCNHMNTILDNMFSCDLNEENIMSALKNAVFYVEKLKMNNENINQNNILTDSLDIVSKEDEQLFISVIENNN